MHADRLLSLLFSIVVVSLASSACALALPVPDLRRLVTADGRSFVLPQPYTITDVEMTGSIEAGESRTVTINTAAKVAILTFEGTPDRQISGHVGNVTIGSSDCCSTAVALYNAEGTLIGSPWRIGRNGAFLDAFPLPATGRYILVVDPEGEETGSLTLALHPLPPNLAWSLAINGPALTTAITAPGQNSHMEFFGTAGQQVTITVTDNTLCSVQVLLYREGQPTLTSSATTSPPVSAYKWHEIKGQPTLTSFATTSCTNSFQLPPQTLPETGPYLIFIDPSRDYIGNLTLNVTSP